MRTGRWEARARAGVAAAALWAAMLLMPAGASAQPAGSTAPAVPDFAALEADGATIGEIRIVNRDIFDPDDPKENKLLYRWANALHHRTRTDTIERSLLFKRGDPVSVRTMEETERLLRSTRYLYDVRLRPVAYWGGVADIEVETRDTWTLDVGLSASRSGGANSSGANLKEYNLLGTGIALSYDRSSTVDRSGNEFRIAHDRAFDGWTSLAYSRASNSDGKRVAGTLAHPFYALDARWAAGATYVADDRIDSVYNAGVVTSQYRHRSRQGEVYGGWSTGRVDGWVYRSSIGVSLQDDAYALEPGRAAPALLPPDEKRVTPFVRLQIIEDRIETLRNRNQMGRPEYFAMGLTSTLQLGRVSPALGATLSAWQYRAALSRGFEPALGHRLLGTALLTGEATQGRVQHQRLGATAQYYLQQGPSWLFYGALAVDRLTHPGPADELLLGGDNGLRGYPLRYQSGQRRALLTLEQRGYTDWYPLNLFRVGGAVFFDAGRAWGGTNANSVKPGWLADAGFGLRIFSVRSAFDNALHIDLAFPIDPDVDVKRVQLVVKTKASF